MAFPHEIETPRLRLVAGTPALAQAALQSPNRFAALLGAYPDPGWPTPIIGGALTYFADTLASHPERTGWLIWYVIRKSDPAGGRVIGSTGFNGMPDEDGSVRVGFSIVDTHRGHGYATEAVKAMMDWAFAHGAKRCYSQTFSENVSAIRVLEKCGMTFAGELEEGMVIYEKVKA
ncbi:acetyltransferase, ribosomal protein N-acetylase [Desulfocurvibacter africanus PCS]|uniref:Acetyltransferase, ribosomal protein N-acetylase n=1 Tax=Desulfocurvibacter africanus PCS TaxID=1262666 RepID=M5PY96_DESAF|nr:GNAT family protein [Desulfocurvibacter africanus]EMG39039.1 acetyltransferase, ribosomal protein N-acetylase [Desulfocurvibacter africanus PCS]